ncbi:MAG: hypothetical protein A3F83_09620 [Candidatus Glassbacteria bacterium RIFCSPLOWO2_12_FULL_58_11]|uniref:Uncharacterized protein n=1 Tax=Candidatus Glassbacteria bacterium RIFCSPLOWO2_12_FULL_58_11 TaxID=1817867 RepID=A0A1F5YJI2_9BACT|nr:MAG: hypothetical protein A3F83_09620 [Candidatus Glassbacteria bacterium RIFCSPLOWO2_12_FULL_58_11]
MATPAGLLGISLLGWVMVPLIFLMAWKAWRWSRQVPPESLIGARAGLAGVALLFSAVLTVWAWPVS